MDLMDFGEFTLYFDLPLPEGVEQLIAQAGDCYGSPQAEVLLQQAEQLAPDHPVVLVARYRYHFYQHQLPQALQIGERLFCYTLQRLGQTPNTTEGVGVGWTQLDATLLEGQDMGWVRFCLTTLKAMAYIQLRLGEITLGKAMLQQVAQLDPLDRLGAAALLAVLNAAEMAED